LSYLLNTWYAAAHAHEVQTAPFARQLLDNRIVFYRDSGQQPVALQDRCPHRFAPLSRGTIQGDEIQCGYHGMRFNATGRCSHNPHGPIPPKAAVRSYPVVERFGVIWIWPGEAERADPELIPDFPFLNDAQRFAVIPGYLHVKANYQLIVDNLLDLSHALFIHPHFAIPGMSVEQQLSAVTSRTVTEGNRISALRTRLGVPPNAPTREIFGFGPEPVDSRSNMHWYPPALLRFDVGSCLSGTPEEDGLCMPQAHLITPETELTSHYFFIATHNLRRDDPNVGRKLFDTLDRAFREQDEPMIEAVQAQMGATSDLDSLHPLLLRTDGAPIAARRMLQRLIAAEQTTSAAAQPTSGAVRQG
jgi:phenylpropionate dioxygenase-like ring-hydroxylating dioxygenase large terminal subunit